MIRSLEASEWPKFNALLDQGFNVAAGASFFDDFPVWAQHRGVTVYGDFDDEGQLLACAGIRRALQGAVDIGLVGAVATDSSVRGQGRATRIMEHLIAEARSQALAGLYLWTSDRALYERLGFRAFGALAYIPVDLFQRWLSPDGTSPDRPKTYEVTFGTGWRDELMDCLIRRPLGVRHTREDQQWLAEHKNTEWHWAELDGKVIAYGACGRGIDMQDIVHEWGVSDLEHKDVLSILVARIARNRSRCFVLVGRELLQRYAIKNDAFDPLASRDTLAGVGLRDSIALSLVFEAEKLKDLTIWFWGLDAV